MSLSFPEKQFSWEKNYQLLELPSWSVSNCGLPGHFLFLLYDYSFVTCFLLRKPFLKSLCMEGGPVGQPELSRLCSYLSVPLTLCGSSLVSLPSPGRAPGATPSAVRSWWPPRGESLLLQRCQFWRQASQLFPSFSAKPALTTCPLLCLGLVFPPKFWGSHAAHFSHPTLSSQQQ